MQIGPTQTGPGTIGARLDRLPLSGFHTRIVTLIAIGLFLDVFDIYLAGGVLAALSRAVGRPWRAMRASLLQPSLAW